MDYNPNSGLSPPLSGQSNTPIEFNFSNSNNGNKGEVKIENQKLPKNELFRYLRSIMTMVREIGADVIHRIKVG